MFVTWLYLLLLFHSANKVTSKRQLPGVLKQHIKDKTMEKGVVKWFNNAKGYGFILSEKDNQDVFVHYSSIDMNGYRTLRTGQPVMFDSIAGPKGFHATAIKLLDGDDEASTENVNVLGQSTQVPQEAEQAPASANLQ